MVALLAIGAAYDLWRAMRPLAAAPSQYPASTARFPRSGVSGAGAPRETTAARDSAAPRVDLNRADAMELDRLPGIGPVLAQRIVEHRARHGPFRRIEELRAVRGVGPRLLERLRSHVRLGSAGPAGG